MRKISLFFGVLLSSSFALPHFQLGGLIENFNWQEYGDGASKNVWLLTEDGYRYGLQAELGLEVLPKIRLQLPVSFVLGRPAYNGHLQNGTPYKSNTFYRELNVNIKGVYDYNSYVSFGPKLHFRNWTRVLSSKGFSEAHTDTGYIERWSFPAVGAFVQLRPYSSFYTEFGVLRPLYISETVELPTSKESVESHLNPVVEWIPQLALGWRYQKWDFSTTIESIHFKASSFGTLRVKDGIVALGTYQPYSELFKIQFLSSFHFN